MKSIKNQLDLHLMIIPGIILVIIFSYVPILGNVIAFKNFSVIMGIGGSPWNGLENFKYVFTMPDTLQVIWNTFYISFLKIVFGLFTPLLLALLMNEMAHKGLKSSVQTALYLPHFMSWIILGGIFIELLSLQGPINGMLGLVGIKPVFFLGDNSWFRFTLVATDVWKEMGFNTIIYMAALTSIDTSLYEAAVMDGAGRWRQTWHITLPGMRAIIILVGTLSLGSILNAGFEQVYTLYSPSVYKTGDILDTFVYRLGLVQAQYGPATAVGLFKSAISCAMISLSYYLAYRYAEYRIF